MTRFAYYNEFDPYAAAWLRNLIAAGHLPAGEVDERSIVDVRGDDLRGFVQCHFFAGIGGWAHALRLAGWPDDRPVWTGSCPCQPFSAAGKRKGTADARHLWPEFQRLIAECCPPVVFGEQVASKDGRTWLSGVRADLEALGYGVGAADLCAAGVGAPHIRQRLWWVANSDSGGRRAWWDGREDEGRASESSGLRVAGRLADADSERRDREHSRLRQEAGERPASDLSEVARSGEIGRLEHPGGGGISRLADAGSDGREQRNRAAWGDRTKIADGCSSGRLADPDGGLAGDGGLQPGRQHGQQSQDGGVSRLGDADDAGPQGRQLPAERAGERAAGPPSLAGFWSDAEWLPCTDGKARRAEPGIFPLAHGVPARVGKLRAAGNAIVPQVAAEFIRAYAEIVGN